MLVGGIGHHPGDLPGRDNASLTEPTSRHANGLKTRTPSPRTTVLVLSQGQVHTYPGAHEGRRAASPSVASGALLGDFLLRKTRNRKKDNTTMLINSSKRKLSDAVWQQFVAGSIPNQDLEGQAVISLD